MSKGYLERAVAAVMALAETRSAEGVEYWERRAIMYALLEIADSMRSLAEVTATVAAEKGNGKQ